MAAPSTARIARRIDPAVPPTEALPEAPTPVRFEVADLLARIEAAMRRPRANTDAA